MTWSIGWLRMEVTCDACGMGYDFAHQHCAYSKTVRASAGAKRVRVTYSVTARDAVDGVVAAPCDPRSRSFFKRGRTAVTCRASDKSANTASARFVVTVR